MNSQRLIIARFNSSECAQYFLTHPVLIHFLKTGSFRNVRFIFMNLELWWREISVALLRSHSIIRVDLRILLIHMELLPFFRVLEDRW